MYSAREKRDARFSAVIPTWNEEEWLPGLLANLRRFPEVAEIIVADNDSGDQTRRIAHRNGVHLVTGGRPAVARNNGTKHASSEFILFVDADAAIPGVALRRAAEVLADEQNVAIHFRLAPINGSAFSRACYLLMDAYLRTLSNFGVAQGVGTFLAVRKSSFYSVGGFDEAMEPGEDADVLRRLSKHGNVLYDRSVKVGTSTRRFYIENPLTFSLKTCGWAVLRLLKVRFSVGRYSWKSYPKGLGKAESHFYVDFISREEVGIDGKRIQL
ncbi:glycosyltransferase [Streptomyces sp. NPDC001617]